MLSIAPGTRIFFATGATDMRKGFDGLQGVVSGKLQQDPLSGHLFLFINRRRDKLKILYDLCGLRLFAFVNALALRLFFCFSNLFLVRSVDFVEP